MVKFLMKGNCFEIPTLNVTTVQGFSKQKQKSVTIHLFFEHFNDIDVIMCNEYSVMLN